LATLISWDSSSLSPPPPLLIGCVALSWRLPSNERPLIDRVALSWRPPSNIASHWLRGADLAIAVQWELLIGCLALSLRLLSNERPATDPASQ